MAVRPSVLWKSMPPERRVAAAEAFWNDEHGLDQQVEAIVSLSRRLNFRPKSVQSLPVERRAKLLAQMGDVSDAVASRALIGYHLAVERPLMAAFLDALGIAHEDGLITAEDVAAPSAEQLSAAVQQISSEFPAATVKLYLQTLLAIDQDTWGGLNGLVSETP